MTDALWLLLAAALAFSGMAWLALAMDVHWAQAMQRPGNLARAKRQALRCRGGGALWLALAVCLMADRPSMAVLVWVMLLALAAVVVAMVLSRRPRWLRLWGGAWRFG